MVSTINGDASVPFYKEVGNRKISTQDIPVVAFPSARKNCQVSTPSEYFLSSELNITGEQGWQAELRLRFKQRNGQTYIAERSHRGPLLVQRPFYPEPSGCHVYLVHPPGGVVGGDRLHLHVDVEQDAQVLLTTPAAAKFYRSGGLEAQQSQVITVRHGIAEWLPQETIFYRAALAFSRTHVQLDGHSRFIGWEIPCLGLPARGESFDAGKLRLHFELWRDEQPLLIDRMNVAGNGPACTAAWGLAGHHAIGTLLAYPADHEMVESVRGVLSDQAEFAATLVDQVLVCRCVSNQAEHVRRVFINMWQLLRPQVLHRPAVLPRVWAT